uniref:Uncharacterized protein n=1 Tax=Tetraselmis sp. GSL018 TaxID=582737 RepID=A0A061RQ02_9CHLO|eukprot:CAMPEP_0177626242 /NCGR_PEP_ID=MMETSP0419_2-20121207/30545_1 /TAXON_ID=582737 /ORGANISM="Tetraselmis sp., Strain GSL018" /LENGTH=283 /DNA_ID=CAMNT_0019127275 /DNA_START=117 /DNA_END=968 /DNA_ORIENTATION=-
MFRISGRGVSQGFAPVLDFNRKVTTCIRGCRYGTKAEQGNLSGSSNEKSENGAKANSYSKVYEKKATWEGTFGRNFANSNAEQTSGASSGISPPWQALGQLNEANLVWNDQLQLRLLKTFIAKEHGIPEEHLEGRLVELIRLLPDIEGKLPKMKVQIVGALVADTQNVARRLVALKGILPGANVSQLACRCTQLLLMDEQALGQVREKVSRLRAELEGVDVDALISAHPVEVLDVGSFLEAIGEARRLMPGLDIAQTLAHRPSQIFSFQKGSSLIPYDGVLGD